MPRMKMSAAAGLAAVVGLSTRAQAQALQVVGEFALAGADEIGGVAFAGVDVAPRTASSAPCHVPAAPFDVPTIHVDQLVVEVDGAVSDAILFSPGEAGIAFDASRQSFIMLLDVPGDGTGRAVFADFHDPSFRTPCDFATDVPEETSSFPSLDAVGASCSTWPSRASGCPG